MKLLIYGSLNGKPYFKCCEKYRMEIAESKAMMIIERGGQVDAEEAMWREIRALRWSFGIEGTSVIFSQA